MLRTLRLSKQRVLIKKRVFENGSQTLFRHFALFIFSPDIFSFFSHNYGNMFNTRSECGNMLSQDCSYHMLLLDIFLFFNYFTVSPVYVPSRRIAVPSCVIFVVDFHLHFQCFSLSHCQAEQINHGDSSQSYHSENVT